MSGIHSNDTEVSEFNSNINIVGSEYDENNHLSVVSAYNKRLEDNTQHLQVPKKQKLPNNRKEVYKNSEPNDKATKPSFPVAVSTTEYITKVLKCQLIATLIITICTITLLSLVPVVLYTINPPHASIEVDVFQPMIFATCSVSL